MCEKGRTILFENITPAISADYFLRFVAEKVKRLNLDALGV